MVQKYKEKKILKNENLFGTMECRDLQVTLESRDPQPNEKQQSWVISETPLISEIPLVGLFKEEVTDLGSDEMSKEQ